MKRPWTCLFVVILVGCGGSSQTLAPAMANTSSLRPAVWQRGATPVQWTMLSRPSGNDLGYVYSWPLLDGSIVAFGATCCYPGGAPPNGVIEGMNISGTLVSVPGINPPASTYQDEEVPIRIFPCAQGTQICSTGTYYVYGPGDVSYYFRNQSAPDAVAGSGNDVWFTVCCSDTYIVHGVNGEMHYYRTPASLTDKTREIARTADGSIWVTLQHENSSSWILARLDPATSVVTEYPLQLPQSPPQLLIGPDGNIWFALQSTLYRVAATDAGVTRFTLPQPSTGYLATGPNATIWTAYVNASSDQGLIEASESGAVLGTFRCPAAVCVPDALDDTIQQLTQGPDGNMWFAYSNTTIHEISSPDDPYEGLGVYVLQAMSVSPDALTFTSSGQTASITISEANYSGTWTAGTTEPSVVQITGFTKPNVLEVRSAGAGSGRVVIHDEDGNYYGVTVTVE